MNARRTLPTTLAVAAVQGLLPSAATAQVEKAGRDHPSYAAAMAAEIVNTEKMMRAAALEPP